MRVRADALYGTDAGDDPAGTPRFTPATLGELRRLIDRRVARQSVA